MANSQVASVYLGETGKFATDVDATPFSTYAAGQLGAIIYDKATDAYYQYVLMHADASPTPAAGLLVFWKDKANFVVTTKVADSPASYNGVAGVLIGVLSAGSYGWIKKQGRALVSVTAGTGVATSLVVPEADANALGAMAGADTAAAYIPVGYCSAITGTFEGTTVTSSLPLCMLTLLKA